MMLYLSSAPLSFILNWIWNSQTWLKALLITGGKVYSQLNKQLRFTGFREEENEEDNIFHTQTYTNSLGMKKPI